MADIRQFVIGFILMLVAIMIGYTLSWVGGQTIDVMYNNATPIGQTTYLKSQISGTSFYQKTVSPTFGVYGVNWNVNLFYLICYGIPLLGVALYFQSLVKVQAYDQYSMANQDLRGQSSRRSRRRVR